MTKLYAAITKVDPDQRIVEGYASTEALDSQGERVSRSAIEGALADYMKFGNIREMHQPSAVGKTQTATMDEKGLKISVKVVDDNAWKKVKEGVYNGFSIGGNATHKVDETIEALDLTEISLVDRPACPEALITLWKAAGTNPMTTKAKTKADISKALQTVSKTAVQKSAGLCNAAQLASTLESLNWVVTDAEWADQYQNDDSPVPDMLRLAYAQLAEAYKAMAAEAADHSVQEQAKQAGVVELAAKAKLKKGEGEEEEEEAAAKTDEEVEAEAAAAEATEQAKEEEAAQTEEQKAEEAAAAAPAREYSDDDKLALKAVYRMMKESGVLETLKAEEDAAAAEAAPAEEADTTKSDEVTDEEAEKARKAEEAAAVQDEEAEAAKKKSDEEQDTEKAEGAVVSEDEEAEKARKAEGAEEEEAEEVAEKMAKAMGLGKSDAAILKAAGFSSAKQAIGALAKANSTIATLTKAVETFKAMPAMTKGVLRVVDRSGAVTEVTPADMIAKGAKPVDVLAKVLSGELDTGSVAKYAGFQHGQE